MLIYKPPIDLNRLFKTLRNTFRIVTDHRAAMGKRKSSSNSSSELACQSHSFNINEKEELRKSLLEWYDTSKRDLPWRNLEPDDINKAYGVWVSEIMLQQTQVATVLDYYKRWMETWPTVADLAQSTLEEVNQKWSGLGYYSRGRRLREGAIKVMEELDGKVPSTATELVEKLPGVGRYTAGAIASIAFGQVTGLVDGNVLRVFSRMRGIGADISTSHVVDAMWNLANGTVDEERPGDFNQSLMELGATVCTPKSPECSKCPVKSLCCAMKRVELEKQRSASKLQVTQKQNGVNTVHVPDIEDGDGCKLCFAGDETWDSSLGVMNYPRKGRKKAPREERTCVCVVQTTNDPTRYLISQRPEAGLLANLWEFPSVQVDLDARQDGCWEAADKHMIKHFDLQAGETSKRQFVDEVVHIFSHIHQTYVVLSCLVQDTSAVRLDRSTQSTRWVTKEEFLDSAISTAMKKVFKSLEMGAKDHKDKRKQQSDGKKQLGMTSFFKPTPKKT